jgi:hypothetical protein
MASAVSAITICRAEALASDEYVTVLSSINFRYSLLLSLSVLVVVLRDPGIKRCIACHNRGADKIHIDRLNRVDDSQTHQVRVEASFYDKLAPFVVPYGNVTTRLFVLLASRACLYV